MDQPLTLNVRLAMDVNSTSKSRTTDWTKCCLCQLDKKEDLKSPQANPSKRGHDGYVNLARNIPLFQSRLDEGGGIEETLMHDIMRVAGSCSTTQSYTELRKDQPQ